MDKLNLLIADGTNDFAEALSNALQDSYRIHRCRNGKEALEQLHRIQPEVFVLDLMIPELDGITLLHKAVNAGICPMVLATTRLLNDYVTETAKELNIGYIMVKPCDPEAAAERVRDLSRRIHSGQSSRENPKVFVVNLLISLNVPSHLRGTAFLRESILLMCRHPDISITKELYPAVGNMFGANYAQVERAIRNAINLAWEHRDEGIWSRYFHSEPNGAVPRPSNGIFISRLADELRVIIDNQSG